MSKQQFATPPVASLDFNEHLRNAYWNAENSLNLFQASGGTAFIGAPELGSRFESKIAWEKFEGNVDILAAMIKGTPTLNTDETFKKACLVTVTRVKEKNPDYLHDGRTPEFIETETKEKPRPLDVFQAITELFHRKLIFKPPVTVFGGHL